MLPHVLPIGGSVLQFPRDEGLSLPRDRESDAGIRVQSIPQHIAEKTKESDKGEDKGNNNEGDVATGYR